MAKRAVRYFSDDLTEDIAKDSVKNIKRKPVTEKFRYYPTRLFPRAARWFVKRVLLRPVARAVLFFCGVKVVGREKTKPFKNGPAFMYGNHTGYFTDAFDPVALAAPRESFWIVNADSVSIFGTRHLALSAGAIPIPDDYHFMPKFMDALSRAVERRGWVAVYPEAHIWEYYTKIRPFPAVSFRYPVKYGAPVFSFTLTYQKRKRGRRPKRTLYVDGPFFADVSLPEKEAAEKLRDEVFSAMSEAAADSDYEYVEYVYRPRGGGA
ncbi:MAG: hypothetical protein LUD29_00880 [Clostridia bacterium]|nr:hypothetical protein [Clostridia bacterium]